MLVRSWAQRPEADRAAIVRNALMTQDPNLLALFLYVRTALPADAAASFNDLIDKLSRWDPK
jgi:hypothetical protein